MQQHKKRVLGCSSAGKKLVRKLSNHISSFDPIYSYYSDYLRGKLLLRTGSHPPLPKFEKTI